MLQVQLQNFHKNQVFYMISVIFQMVLLFNHRVIRLDFDGNFPVCSSAKFTWYIYNINLTGDLKKNTFNYKRIVSITLHQ